MGLSQAVIAQKLALSEEDMENMNQRP
jgi:hypothetical protein